MEEKFYLTGRPCKNGHIEKRDVKRGTCIACKASQNRRFRRSQPEYQAEWIKKNRDQHNFLNKEWRKRNIEQARIADRKRRKRVRQEKRVELLAYNASRRANKKSSTPKWANLKKIERIYMLAAWASKFTDERLHVDHIIPMRGKQISGLHIESNLQILTATENLVKGNKFLSTF